MTDLLTLAEADALAAPFRPAARAGVSPWTPLTLEAHREREPNLRRPITDTVTTEGIRVVGGSVAVLGCNPSDREIRNAKQRRERALPGARDGERQRHRDRRLRAAHIDATNAALGVVIDFTFMRAARADAYRHALTLRSAS